MFWTSRTPFPNTLRTAAPVGFSTQAFLSFTRNETRVLTGTSVNVIRTRSGGTAGEESRAKLCQLGCAVVLAPTPFTHACAEAGRLVRRFAGRSRP